jgi:hypothetical protein
MGSAGAIGRNLVATTRRLRCDDGSVGSVAPMIRSERPGPYASAVSIMVIPSSAARRRRAGATSEA